MDISVLWKLAEFHEVLEYSYVRNHEGYDNLRNLHSALETYLEWISRLNDEDLVGYRMLLRDGEIIRTPLNKGEEKTLYEFSALYDCMRRAEEISTRLQKDFVELLELHERMLGITASVNSKETEKLAITPESIAQLHGVPVDCVRIGETPEGGAYTIIAQGGRYISFTEYDENHNEVFRTSGYLTE